MSDWLVPVSRYVRFAQSSGHTVDNSFNALQDAVLAGRLSKVECDPRGPLVEVSAGDELWFYTSDLEAGVFAVGTARRPARTKRPVITVTIDKARTRLLAADPLPAGTIRRWVPELRQGAVGLDLRPRALAVLEGWQGERGERDVSDPLVASLLAVVAFKVLVLLKLKRLSHWWQGKAKQHGPKTPS